MDGPLWLLAPPYDRLEPVPSGHDVSPPEGALLWLRVAGWDPEGVLGEALRLGVRAPWAPLVVEMGGAGPVALSALEAAGAAAVVGPGTPPREVVVWLRRRGFELASELPHRLRLFRRGYPAQFGSWLEALLRELGPGMGVREWASMVGRTPRAVETNLSRWGLPPPRRWVELVRVLRVVEALQRAAGAEAERTLAEAAGPDADPKRLRALVRELCGCAPARAGALVGWYWILGRWLRRHWPVAVRARRAAGYGGPHASRLEGNPARPR